MDKARRAFLRGAPLLREHRVPLAPPPPWLGDLPQKVCIACPGFCLEACGERVIRRHPDDHALAGLPYLAFQEAGCTFCGACAEACPHADAAGGIRRIGTAILATEACLAWNRVICMSCLRRCPEQAIALDRHQRPSISQERCTGCGMCISPCPTAAITIHFNHHHGRFQ